MHVDCVVMLLLRRTDTRPGAGREFPRPLVCVRGALWPFAAGGRQRPWRQPQPG